MIVTNRPSVNRSRAATLSRDYLRHGDFPELIRRIRNYGFIGNIRQSLKAFPSEVDS